VASPAAAGGVAAGKSGPSLALADASQADNTTLLFTKVKGCEQSNRNSRAGRLVSARIPTNPSPELHTGTSTWADGLGEQAQYVSAPCAGFNLLKFPDRRQAMEKIRNLILLSDIFPNGYHGAVRAGVGPGSTVYVAGAGPVGLACAVVCHLLGATVVTAGDVIPVRLDQVLSFGCETVARPLEAGKFLSNGDWIKRFCRQSGLNACGTRLA
jgi:threonine dehydrogenase-like Zn-dependent dehydrogenase